MKPCMSVNNKPCALPKLSNALFCILCEPVAEKLWSFLSSCFWQLYLFGQLIIYSNAKLKVQLRYQNTDLLYLPYTYFINIYHVHGIPEPYQFVIKVPSYTQVRHDTISMGLSLKFAWRMRADEAWAISVSGVSPRAYFL